MAKPYTYGEDNQERTRRVLEVLLTYSDPGIDRGKIKCLKTGRGINFEISKQDLIKLITVRYKLSDWENDIRPVISHYLGWLGILQDNRTTTRGSSMWKFSLNLWCDDTTENLKRFNEEWVKKSPDRQKKAVREDSPPQKSQIDWLDRSRQLLKAQKHLTTNRLLNKSNRNLDDIHVPLGLIERKERPKVKEEPSPEQGSQLYQTEYTETKRFEHETFLADVVGKPAGGKHIAIIGEPGAGKTTLLTKIGAWLIGQAEQQLQAPLVVAWISLADVGDRRLKDYLPEEWLQKVCEDNFDAAWKDWRRLHQQGLVWLLLDGLDEMSGDALAAIHRDLEQSWAQNLRVVMTCRINQWETAAGGNILTNSFDVYRMMDYSYQTSQGKDHVKQFIDNWFADDRKVATQIRRSLDDPGKKRIKDLVKNPLRLTLLCASWEKDNQALPETQADLYRGFVNYLYNWKAAKFKDEVKLRQELDLALGKLAKVGLNQQQINDGAVRRFRFTASEISKLWAELPDTLLPAAKNLGWLNVVGEDSGENVYAFYHPTFQEYFAACSIEHWDYFLPEKHVDRPVPCQGESLATYRVFEKQWQQVILFWIGRNDLGDEPKKDLVSKLTNFEQQNSRFFYHYRAYCIAAIYISEFKSLGTTQRITIINQVVKWCFGYFCFEKAKWVNYPYYLESLAREALPMIGEIAINILVQHLERSQLNNKSHCAIVDHLSETTIGRQEIIQLLILLLKKSNLPDRSKLSIMNILRSIAVGSELAIKTIESLLINPPVESYFYYRVAKTLGAINKGNPQALFCLNKLAETLYAQEDFQHRTSQKENYFCYSVAKSLGKIDKGNKQAIELLSYLLEKPDMNSFFYCRVARTLWENDIGNTKVIRSLNNLLNKPDFSYKSYLSVISSFEWNDVTDEDAANIVNAFYSLLEVEIDLGSLTDKRIYNQVLYSRFLIAKALLKIDGFSQLSTDLLTSLLEDPLSNNCLRLLASVSLEHSRFEWLKLVSTLINIFDSSSEYGINNGEESSCIQNSTERQLFSIDKEQNKNYLHDFVSRRLTGFYNNTNWTLTDAFAFAYDESNTIDESSFVSDLFCFEHFMGNATDEKELHSDFFGNSIT
jgi:Effector-associated domain 4/NACHT domain